MLITVTFLSFIIPEPLYARYAHVFSHETVRTIGMGGACIAIADDQQAFFSNPAGLGLQEKKAYAIVNAQAAVNVDYNDVKNKLEDLSSDDTPQARIHNNFKLAEVMGKRGHAAASNMAYYMSGSGFGAAFLYQNIAEASIVRPTNPKVRVCNDEDFVLAGSFARFVGDDDIVFKDHAKGWVGGTLKFVSRRTIDNEFDARDFAALSESELRKNEYGGVAMDLDLGTIWHLNNPWYPSIGLFAANILESTLDADVGRLKRRISLGTAIRPLSGSPERNQKLMLAADIWDLASDASFFVNIRMGAEYKLTKNLKIRGGIRSGYLTCGFTADFRDARIEYATYGEEIGLQAGDCEDRRHSISFLFEF